MNGWALKLRYARKYWKLLIHLTFKTRHFGVNNRWWVAQPSAIGWQPWQILWGIVTVMPIVRNVQSLKVRSCIGWIPHDECEALGLMR
ncbi:hypothetical protein SAMN05443662_0888 [Sulfurivirga caldicuralii]|uniref:Uncharacterized protein n=1 Tax=Sulfurivirga caldicuralii TaxID=364032 RepID=A0A1N6F2Q8_9GAMM|nr:hypothetical protein [Sulfurivirga caldicuralii]SIN89509.1 hypothetical protein SAMN05443662_0888 [Sulfurivirga caldicuralii]